MITTLTDALSALTREQLEQKVVDLHDVLAMASQTAAFWRERCQSLERLVEPVSAFVVSKERVR